METRTRARPRTFAGEIREEFICRGVRLSVFPNETAVKIIIYVLADTVHNAGIVEITAEYAIAVRGLHDKCFVFSAVAAAARHRIEKARSQREEKITNLRYTNNFVSSRYYIVIVVILLSGFSEKKISSTKRAAREYFSEYSGESADRFPLRIILKIRWFKIGLTRFRLSEMNGKVDI